MNLKLLFPMPILALLAACSSSDEPDVTPTATAAIEILTATASAPAGAVTVIPSATATLPSATSTPTVVATPASAQAVTAARADLARWLGPVGNPAAITVTSVEAKTWSNGCLELSRPGQVCTQALVGGYRIDLTVANATYELRTDATGNIVLWAPKVQILAKFAEASPNIFRFTTDDGGEIVAQVVPGTDYGVDASTLQPGDPVGLGLADAPQSGGLILVWLDEGP